MREARPAPDEAAQDVTALLVGPQEVSRRADGGQALDRRRGQRVPGADEGGGHRGAAGRHDDGEAEHRLPVAAEDTDELEEGRPRGAPGAGLDGLDGERGRDHARQAGRERGSI